MANAFLTSKLLSAERVSHGDYSLFQLLGCQDEALSFANFCRNVLSVTRCSKALIDLYHPTPLPRSYTNVTKHVAALRQCQLKDGDVLVVRGHAKEGWGGLWVLRLTNGKPFVLAVDYQFREVRGKESTPADGRHKVSNRQAKHFQHKIVAACKTAFPNTSEYDESAAAAIAAGDFAFVYIDTAPSKDTQGHVSRVFADDDHYVRLTGPAAWEALTDAGRQVLEIVRLSSQLPPPQPPGNDDC